MAGEFDPDAYLNEGAADAPSPAFDPDAYLAEPVPTSAQPAEAPVEQGGQTAEQARYMDTVEAPSFQLPYELAPLGAPPKPAPAEDPAVSQRFREAVGLSDPLAPAIERDRQQQLEREELVRSGFKPEPGLSPEQDDARVANHFGIGLNLVKANREGWLDAFAKASGDPKKWIAENPFAARLIFDHPERAEEVVSNKEQNVLLKGLNAVLDFATDTWAAALRVEADNPALFAPARAVRSVVAPVVTGVLGEVGAIDIKTPEEFADTVTSLSEPRTPERQAAVDAERAKRDAPREAVELDNDEARTIREGGALAIAAQRAKESRAGLEVSVLYTKLGSARGRGQDTAVLEAQIRDAEAKATGLALGETGWTQALSDSWGQAQSSLDVLGTVLERGGAGAVVGAIGGAVVGRFTPLGPVAGASRGASIVGKAMGVEGAAERSFTLEFGDRYKNLLSAKTDAGKPLTEEEARGGALISAAVATGIELAELTLIMKALGPAGAFFEKGGLEAVKAALATNPGMRVLAVRAAKAWAGEGVEEVSQDVVQDVTAYLVKSKSQGVLQAGPVIDVEAKKESFTMALLGGGPIGVGSFATAAGTHAVFKDSQARGATQGVELAKLAADPASAAMADELAGLIEKKSAETGFPVTHTYFEAADFKTFFQTAEEATAAAEQVLGEAGAQKLVEAEASGGRIAVPTADFIGRFGKVPGLAEHLSKKLATSFEGLSEQQLAEQKKADADFAKAIADQETREAGVSPTLDKLDGLEEQLVATGNMTKAEAKDALQPMRDTFHGFAKKFGQSAEDLFRNVRINVDDGVAKLLVEYKKANASALLSEQLNTGKIDTEQAAEILFVDDVTDLHTFEGFEQMEAETPSGSVVAVTLTDIKPVNDSVAGGHGVSDSLLRDISPAIAAADPLAARKGTNFVIRGDAKTLEQVLRDVQARLPKGMHVAGAVGADAKAALEAMDKRVDAGRLSGEFPTERSDTHVKDLDQQLPAIEAELARRQEKRKTKGASHRVKVTESQKTAAAALKAPDFFRLAFQDKTVPGVLSAAAWARIPRKANVASIDIKGLKNINILSEKLHGKGNKKLGDQVLQMFAEVVRDFDGSDFDIAHLSGDEYAAQHDSQEKLQAWLDRIDAELTKRAITYEADLGDGQGIVTDKVRAEMRHGIGKDTYGNADRVLNANKLREKQNLSGGVQRPAAQERVDRTGGPDRVRQEVPGGEVRGAARGAGEEVGDARRGSLGGVDGDRADASGRDPRDRLGADRGVLREVPGRSSVPGATEITARAAEGRPQSGRGVAPGVDGSSEGVGGGAAAAGVAAGVQGSDASGRGDRAGAGSGLRLPVPGVQGDSSAGAVGGVRGVDRGAQATTPQAGRDVLPGAGDQAVRYEPRGAAPQGYIEPGRAQAVAVGGVSFEQDSLGKTDIAWSGVEKIFRIGLKPNANKSTFLHESAHVFLDIFSDLSQRADAPDSVREDWATTLKWLGVTQEQWSRMNEKEMTPFHEKWAKAFEHYLAKGEYPTSRLAGAFKRFRLWMGVVYKQLTQLGEVSPEIKGVFDRLLATDEEIAAQAEGLRLKVSLPHDMLGMDIQEWSNHLDDAIQATSHARELVDFQVAKDELRTTESWWKQAHREAKAEAAAEYEGLTARKAQRLLDGEIAAGVAQGSPITLNRAEVEGWIGKQRAKSFRLAADGVSADHFLEAYGGVLGYEVGRDLVEAIAALPSKEDFVDGRATQLMVERYPGVLDDRQRLRELVSKGLHGEKTSSWLLKEIAALSSRGPKGASRMPPVRVIKQAAELMVAGRTARELDVHGAQVAERKAALDATKAAARGDYAQAAEFRKKQLLNGFLQDALREAKKEVEAFELLADKLSTLKARQRLGKGSPVYRDAVAHLLATFGLAEPTGELAGSLDALLAESERLMAENMDSVAFDRARLLDRAQVATVGPVWKALALEDVRQLKRALENLEAAARNRATVLLDGKRLDKELTVEQLQMEAEALEKRPEEPTQEAETAAQGLGRRWTQFDGGLLKVETMARWLSGAKDTAAFIKSTWFKAIVEPMQKAKTLEQDLFRKHLTPLVAVWKAIPKEASKRWNESIAGRKLFPGHIDQKLPQKRWEVLMMLLHSGNESNLQRLTEGRGITEQQLRDAAIAVGVTKEEYAWIQSIWDTAEGLKPLAFDLEEADSGVRPEAIPARAFDTPHGKQKGGYFPAVYDRITQVGAKQEATLAGFQDSSYTRPATSHNFLKQRSEGFTDIISLSPASIQRHFVQVVHDVSHRQAIKSVGTLLLDKRVQATLRERLGSGRGEQFMQWVGDVARMRGATASDGLSWLNSLASTVRGNIVVSVLGYKVLNAAEDATSNLLGALPASDLKGKHLAGAVYEATQDMAGTRKLVLEKSGELRARQDQVQRELAKQLKHLTEEGIGKLLNQGPIGWYKDHAFFMAEAAEVVTGTVIWLGAYRQALAAEGTTDAEAVTFADATVRQVMVSHSPTDLSTIMRNKGVIGHMLMFHGAFNHFYNQFRSLQQQGNGKATAGLIATKSGKALGLAVGLFVVGSLVRGQGPDEGEPYEDWLFRKMAFEGFMQLVPGAGAIGNVLANASRDKITLARNNSLMGVAGNVTDSMIKAAKSDNPKTQVKAALQVIGPLTGVPTSAPLQAADSALFRWVMED